MRSLLALFGFLLLAIPQLGHAQEGAAQQQIAFTSETVLSLQTYDNQSVGSITLTPLDPTTVRVLEVLGPSYSFATNVDTYWNEYSSGRPAALAFGFTNQGHLSNEDPGIAVAWWDAHNSVLQSESLTLKTTPADPTRAFQFDIDVSDSDNFLADANGVMFVSDLFNLSSRTYSAGYAGTNTLSSGTFRIVTEPTTTSVPEPASLSVLGVGFAGMLLRRRRKIAA